jgi:hypothetical protein
VVASATSNVESKTNYHLFATLRLEVCNNWRPLIDAKISCEAAQNRLSKLGKNEESFIDASNETVLSRVVLNAVWAGMILLVCKLHLMTTKFAVGGSVSDEQYAKVAVDIATCVVKVADEYLASTNVVLFSEDSYRESKSQANLLAVTKSREERDLLSLEYNQVVAKFAFHKAVVDFAK